jgi:hypothetical protein
MRITWAATWSASCSNASSGLPITSFFCSGLPNNFRLLHSSHSPLNPADPPHAHCRWMSEPDGALPGALAAD